MENYLWLIPGLPAVMAVVLLIIGRFLPRMVASLLACTAILGSFAFSLILFLRLLEIPADNRVLHQVFYTWMEIGVLKAQFAFLVDPLSVIMILVVTGVGFLIHVYSIGYMADDRGYARYFGFLNLFIFFMLLLVLADNLLVMFIGWEGVGLCSYFLIGFWFEKTANAIAGMKAFIVNRIGDFGFILGMLLLFWQLGVLSGQWTLNFAELKQYAQYLTPAVATAVGILLFIGACGKSAQIPLHVWLPDAMAGPTPVSALIHAATMVTAGVYMIARMNFIYILSPAAMMVVAIVGVATALLAATIGLFQKDIKKVLAYSTISQLGYMFLGVGVGAFGAGIFHLMTHAFFKALLFMAAGSVIHGTGGEQDMEKMGGLRKYMPVTFWTFLAGSLAIAGIPGLSGFFSKDEILWQAFSAPGGHWALWLIGFLSAGLTAFYIFRLVFKVFLGRDNSESVRHEPVHESPWVMTGPLVVLAVLAIISGYVGIPGVIGGGNQIEHFMSPVFGSTHPLVTGSDPAHSLEMILMVISALMALAGIGMAYYFYVHKPHFPGQLAVKFFSIYRVVFNKYYVDEIYQKVFIASLLRLNNFLAYKIDLRIIDRLVNAIGMGTVRVSEGGGWADNKFIDGSANGVAGTVLISGQAAAKTQTGKLKDYLVWAVAGILAFSAGLWILLKQ